MLVKQSIFKKIAKHKVLYFMLMPTLLYFIIFRYGPMFGLVIAFQDFQAKFGQSFFESILSSNWVGLKHFKTFFSDTTGINVLKNTIIISVYKLLFGFPAPVLLALMINELRVQRFKKVVQTLSYLPYFMSWVILAGVLRVVFSPDYGVILPMLKMLGIGEINFLGDSRYFRGLLVLSDIWQNAGWGSVVYLAALSAIDESLYEAARIDGASRMQQMIFITLPSIAATISVMFILRTGQIMNAGFDQVFNLYNSAVYSVGDIIDTYVYRMGLQQAQFSYTAAVGFFQSLVGFILVLISNIVSKRMGQDGIL